MFLKSNDYVLIEEYLCWSSCTSYLLACQFTGIVGLFRSLLLYLCDVFRALVNLGSGDSSVVRVPDS